jgi:hypothetical protein
MSARSTLASAAPALFTCGVRRGRGRRRAGAGGRGSVEQHSGFSDDGGTLRSEIVVDHYVDRARWVAGGELGDGVVRDLANRDIGERDRGL